MSSVWQRNRQREVDKENSPNSDNVVEYVWIGFHWRLPWQLYLIVWQLPGVEELRRCAWSWEAGERLSSNVIKTSVSGLINTGSKLKSDALKIYMHWQLRTSDGPSGRCQRERGYCPEIKNWLAVMTLLLLLSLSETWLPRAVKYLWRNIISKSWNREM